MFGLPRYFRYSLEAKQVESTRTGSDISFIGMFTCVLKFLLCFKESKEKKQKVKREEYGETRRSGNIEDKIFVVFDILLKQSKKRKKIHGY